MKTIQTDVVIIGSGIAGLSCALKLPESLDTIIITKERMKDCNSYLAQGGICIRRGMEDEDDFIKDTMTAGHYENDLAAVRTMVMDSNKAISLLEKNGAEFSKNNNNYVYTKEGGHSKSRILFQGDHIGKSIMDALIKSIGKRKNIKVLENCKMEDLLIKKGICYGAYVNNMGANILINANKVVLATGGVGGVFDNTTNFTHIKGDAIALASKYNITLRDISYIQIHPTSFYEDRKGRKFLISESVRGEGGILLNEDKVRFTDELKPRDIVSAAIFSEMKKYNTKHVWLSMKNIELNLEERFPKIVDYLKISGFDPRVDDIPVVPAAHYTMGGIFTDLYGHTNIADLYAVGEVSSTGVHGKNRLASNSLLEAVVFAMRAAEDISSTINVKYFPEDFSFEAFDDKRSYETIKELIDIDKISKSKYSKSR